MRIADIQNQSDRPGLRACFNVCVTNFTSGTVAVRLTASVNSTSAPDTKVGRSACCMACSDGFPPVRHTEETTRAASRQSMSGQENRSNFFIAPKRAQNVPLSRDRFRSGANAAGIFLAS